MARKPTAAELSKKTVGALALAALMSILLAKFFSELALADEPQVHPMPTLDAPAQILGTYRIADIIDHSRAHNGTRCRPYRDANGERNDADDNCGKHVWVARTENQLALMKMSDSSDNDDYLQSILLYGSLLHPKCDSVISAADAKSGLFSSKFCRAFHVRRLDTRRSTVFLFNDDLDPMADAIEGSMLGLAVGVPIGVGSQFTIAVPKSETVPEQINMTETVAGSFLFFINTTFTKDYILRRVAE